MLIEHLANLVLRLAELLWGCRATIFLSLVSVDLEYHDGWYSLKSHIIRMFGIVRRCSIED